MILHRSMAAVCWFVALVVTALPLPGGWWPWRAPAAPPAPDRSEIEAMLRPHRTELATLSRDGRHLAYSCVTLGSTAVGVVQVDAPHQRQRFELGDLEDDRVLALAWTAGRDLVAALESGVIVGIQPEAGVRRILLTPATFARDEVILPDVVGESDEALEPEQVTIRRWPRLLHAAGDTNAVYVEGVAGSTLQDATAEIVRLDVGSGRWEVVDSVRIQSPGTRVHADRAGRFRLIEDRSRLPLRWQVRPDPARRLGGWRPLERVFARQLQAGFLTDRHTLLTGRSFPLGFGRDANVLYFASNVGRSSYGLYAVDVVTGARTSFCLEDPAQDLAWPEEDLRLPPLGARTLEWWQESAAAYSTATRPARVPSPLVFDRASFELLGIRAPAAGRDRWIDPAFQAVQAELDRWFPGRQVRLLDADDARERFAVHVSGENDPGRYFIYQRSNRRCIEYLRRAPGRSAEEIHPVETFALPLPSGRALRGRLTTPRRPITPAAPLVCLFHDGPWVPPDLDYGRLSQLLAELGCRVLELDHAPADLLQRASLDPALRAEPDRRAALAWDAALAWLQAQPGPKPRRVVAVGVGYGGWLALRVAQQRPDWFRGVVAFNGFDSPADLVVRPLERELFDGGSAGLQAAKEAIGHLDALRDDFANSRASGPDEGGAPAADPLGHSRLRFVKRQLHREERPAVHLFAELARDQFAPALADRNAHSASAAAETLRCPVLLVHDAAHPYWPVGDARRLRRRLSASGQAVELWTVPPARWDRSLAHRPEAWPRVAEWLHDLLYRYEVDIGEAREVAP